jgi:hypothetical protein
MMSRITLSLITGLVMAAPGGAEAQSAREIRTGRVSVCSIYGNGCATAPIRPVAYDYEFRMPGGTWVRCRKDCKSALREEVLDFWETLRERSGDRSR